MRLKFLIVPSMEREAIPFMLRVSSFQSTGQINPHTHTYLI